MIKSLLFLLLAASFCHAEMPFSFSVLDETKTDKLHYEFFQAVTITHFPPGKPHLTYSTEYRIYGINQPTFTFNTETYQGDISQKDLTAFLEQAGKLPIQALKTKTEGAEHTTGTIYLGPQLYAVFAPPNKPIRKEWQALLDAFLTKYAPVSRRKKIATTEVGDVAQSETITFQTLLRSPKKYDGQRVKLTGYYQGEFEGSSLAESKKEIENYPKALWLGGSSTFANPKDITFANNTTITAEGTFHLGPGGHMGLWMGELNRLTVLRPAEDRDKK